MGSGRKGPGMAPAPAPAPPRPGLTLSHLHVALILVIFAFLIALCFNGHYYSKAAEPTPGIKTPAPIVTLAEHPRIYVLDNFATPEECHAIEQLAVDEKVLLPAGIMDGKGVLHSSNESRKANTGTLNVMERWGPIVKAVVARMDAVTMLPSSHGQFLQVTEYNPGDYYVLHRDTSTKVGRVATAIIFLEEPSEGGELIFPWAIPSEGRDSPWLGKPRDDAQDWVPHKQKKDKLPLLTDICEDGLRIAPQKGRLVVFWSHDPMGRLVLPYSFHGSCPVHRGRKRIAQRWYQSFPVHGVNQLGSLLEQVGLAERWHAPLAGEQ